MPFPANLQTEPVRAGSTSIQPIHDIVEHSSRLTSRAGPPVRCRPAVLSFTARTRTTVLFSSPVALPRAEQRLAASQYGLLSQPHSYGPATTSRHSLLLRSAGPFPRTAAKYADPDDARALSLQPLCRKETQGLPSFSPARMCKLVVPPSPSGHNRV